MTRSIVLRFDATCFDCGRSLSAGSTARWFGKGRVSCCGGNRQPAPGDVPPRGQPIPLSDLAPAAAPARYVPVAPVAATPRAPVHQDIPPYLGGNRELDQLSRDVGIPVESLSSGLSPDQLAILATKAPNQRLLLRLQSGARCIVPAQHAAHVARCIGESCIDRVRDIALLAEVRP